MTRHADPHHVEGTHARSGESQVALVSVAPSAALSRAAEHEALWLDRLLAAACEMPVGDGESAVVRFMVGALGAIVPSFGVGACLVPPQVDSGPSSSTDLRARAVEANEPQIFRYSPEGEDQRGAGMDRARLFPGFAYERVIPVEAGSTLHLASDDARLEDDGAPILRMVRRAAVVTGHGLGLARAHTKATADARELRALNTRMVQAEKLATLGQIAAGVVHELNNPLTSIVAYTDWLIRKQQATDDADSLERLLRIGESANRILRFTRDLVAYARPSSEVPVAVAVHTVIDKALAFCEHVLAEHHAKVERRFAEGVPLVRGMHEQLVQVFVNLFTNACHAMPREGGRLIVSSELTADRRHLVIVVADNGHGIAPEHFSQVFAPFFTTKADGRGTGLGLSIVKNIMDNHGAEIRAERGDDGGARFALSFPVNAR